MVSQRGTESHRVNSSRKRYYRPVIHGQDDTQVTSGVKHKSFQQDPLDAVEQGINSFINSFINKTGTFSALWLDHVVQFPHSFFQFEGVFLQIGKKKTGRPLEREN